MEIFVLCIVGIIVAAAINARADARHRQNGELIKKSGADKSLVVAAGHGCNSLTGCVLWLALGAALFAVLGGFAVGGG